MLRPADRLTFTGSRVQRPARLVRAADVHEWRPGAYLGYATWRKYFRSANGYAAAHPGGIVG